MKFAFSSFKVIKNKKKPITKLLHVMCMEKISLMSKGLYENMQLRKTALPDSKLGTLHCSWDGEATGALVLPLNTLTLKRSRLSASSAL